MMILVVAAHAVTKHHYGDPASGCLPDERNATVDGMPGDLCAPMCTPNSTSPCPSDVPTGVTAVPQCELTFDDKAQGCCLVCSPSTEVAALRAGDAQCGAGSCQRGVSRHTIGGAAASSLAPRRPIDPPPKRLTLAAVGRVSSQLAQMRSAVRAQAEGESFKKVVPFL